MFQALRWCRISLKESIEHLLLTSEALVDAELVRRARSPGELGEPQRRCRVAVVRHHGAELLDRAAELVEVARVRVQGGDVEVAP